MAKVGGRNITVEQIRKYQERDRKKHPDKYLDLEDLTKRDIIRLRKEVRNKLHPRQRYPRNIWKQPQNIALAAKIAIDDKRRKINRQKRCPECKREFPYNRIFCYPNENEIYRESNLTSALAKVHTLRNFYKAAGCFDPESDYYDPLLETFPQIVTEDKIGVDAYEVDKSFGDEKNIENTLIKLNSLSIVAAATDKEIEDLEANDLQKHRCSGMLRTYDCSVWKLLKSVGLESNSRLPNHYWTENNYENLWKTLDEIVASGDILDSKGKIVLSKLRDQNLGNLLNIIEKQGLSDKIYERYGGRPQKENGYWINQENRFKFYKQLEENEKAVTAITAGSAYAAVYRSEDINWKTEMEEYAAYKVAEAKSF